MKKINKLLGFTLVELIVVITIVWILSTVGFVSYSWYLTWARDSNRISQLTKLSDSLQVYAANKTLPIPDDSIDITASGTLISYQWYVWVDVLETIDYTNGWKDPKDDAYYTYYLTKDRKSFQLLALMEDQQSVVQFIQTPTYAADYSNRYPKVYGEQLWLLTEIQTNTPAQEVSGVTELDIITDWSSYVANISDGKTISGISWNIISVFLNQSESAFIDKDLAQYDTSLVWYWDMETLESWELKDFSSYGNNGILHGGITVGNAAWKVWRSTTFDGNDDYITIPNSSSLNPTEEITIITLSNSNGPWDNSCNETWCYPRIFWKEGSVNAEQYAFWWIYWNDFDGTFQYRLDTSEAIETVAVIDNTFFTKTDNRWNNLIFSYRDGTSRLYINGALEWKWNDVFFWDMIPSSSDLIIWNSNGLSLARAFFWEIDEIRIYNRELTLNEIKRIYSFY